MEAVHLRKVFSSRYPLLAGAILLLTGCGSEPSVQREDRTALRAPIYDATFRDAWNDRSTEVCTYSLERLRDGKLRPASATALTRHAMYSEDERVPMDSNGKQNRDLFPAMQTNWIERYTDGPVTGEEMTTIAVTLTSVDGRVPGVASKVDFSFQGWSGQLFHQLLFDATGVRSHQYSYFANEGDEQITLAYPSDGVAGDALWFWARHVAAPALQPGEGQTVSLLPSLRSVREKHLPLQWRSARLQRAAQQRTVAGKQADVFTATQPDGKTQTFFVGAAAPFPMLRWENANGEHADLVSTSRLKPPPQTASLAMAQ